MILTDSDDEANEVNELAKAMGLSFNVRVSAELLELLKPNPFLAGLGIQFEDRIINVLNVLKGSLIPKNTWPEETVQKGGIVIPIPLVKGPFIREEMVSVRAEMSDDGGETGILLTAMLNNE